MSAQFLAASSQSLSVATPPITAYPFTVGAWIRPTTTGAIRTIWTAGLNTTNYYALFQWNTNQWNCQSSAAGVDADCLGGTVTANSWQFVIGRWISATNRRLSVINVAGTAAFAQNTTNQTNTISSEFIGVDISGATSFFSGNIAEFWKTNTDIQADGAQLQDATLRQLAYGGPLSIPHIAADVVEYRSFRKSPTFDELPEIYYGAKGIQAWTNTNAVIVGEHPPLPYSFVRPGQNKRILMI